MKIQAELLHELQEKVIVQPYGNEYMLCIDFTYDRSRATYWPKKIQIKAWFVFDWASIPRLARWYSCPMSTDTLIAALVHDYLYKNNIWTREEADEIFNEIMFLHLVRTDKRLVFFLGVRIGGWKAWNEHLKSNKKLWKQQ